MGFFDFLRGNKKSSYVVEEDKKNSYDTAENKEEKKEQAASRNGNAEIVLTKVVFSGGYVSPSGGFSNGAYYEISGKNPSTGRINKKKVVARSEVEAMEKVRNEFGLTDMSATCIPFDKPTEKQLDCAKRLHLFIPQGADKNDVACMLHRVADAVPGVEDPDFSPIPACSQEFADYLCRGGAIASSYIDYISALEAAARSFGPREKCRLYAYCVWCHFKKEPVNVPIQHPQEWLFDQFADEYCEDEQFMNLLSKTSFAYIHGNEKAVKIVKEFMKNRGYLS